MAKLTAHALMYHDVIVGAKPGVALHRYALPWASFVEHLDRMESVIGVPPVVFDGTTTPCGANCWLLTFDDGGPGTVEVAEELQRRGWRASFFVASRLIGRPGFVGHDTIRELHAAGHVIGSHSATHPDRMGALSADEVLREWRESVEALSDLLGQAIRVASVPGGSYRKHVAEAAARAGIATLFTSEPVRRIHRIDGCLVVGRYAVRSKVDGDEAAAAAAGDRATWLRQYATWNVRKLAKAVGGKNYDRIRRALHSGHAG
jgi:peptidoglycan/xylan/chitin deacetylase (PgdA/CDA1 family)